MNDGAHVGTLPNVNQDDDDKFEPCCEITLSCWPIHRYWRSRSLLRRGWLAGIIVDVAISVTINFALLLLLAWYMTPNPVAVPPPPV